MRAPTHFLAALVALMLSSCCCPQPPGPCGEVCSVSYPGKPDRPVRVTREYPVSADCQDSKPANPTPQNTLAPTLVSQFVLPVIPRCQEGLYSCWSTVTEMILEFLTGERVDQCRQSNEAFGCADCCGPHGVLIVDTACDSPWYPEFEKWGYGYDSRPFPLSPTEVKNHINQLRQPFAFAWVSNPDPPTTPPTTPPGALNGPGPGESQGNQVAHMLLAIGYGVDNQTGAPALVIIDPHPFVRSDAAIIPHADYDGSSGAYTHWEDCVSFRPLP